MKPLTISTKPVFDDSRSNYSPGQLYASVASAVFVLCTLRSASQQTMSVNTSVLSEPSAPRSPLIQSPNVDCTLTCGFSSSLHN
ncbi:hypothetical protein J6590_018079 [Homalodisca vitripennis]|nr:hypothetical protein J6590_018079 [Homalodisca vitripennis]